MGKRSRAIRAGKIFLFGMRSKMYRKLTFRAEGLGTKTAIKVERVGVNCHVAFE